MSTVNTSGANLQAREDQIEKDVATLGSTLTTAFADLKATIAADLNAAGVPSDVVDGVTAKLGTLDGVIQQFTAQAVAADPGAPVSSETPNPPAAPAAQ